MEILDVVLQHKSAALSEYRAVREQSKCHRYNKDVRQGLKREVKEKLHVYLKLEALYAELSGNKTDSVF